MTGKRRVTDEEIASYLVSLREWVVKDYESEEAKAERVELGADDLCEACHQKVIAELVFIAWADLLTKGDQYAWQILTLPEPPEVLVPAYWADRTWPPKKPKKLGDDFRQWLDTQEAIGGWGACSWTP